MGQGMKASHDTNADNSAAKQAALDAMTAREWTQALVNWKAHWADHPEAADHARSALDRMLANVPASPVAVKG